MQCWWESVELASRDKTSQDIFQHLKRPSDDVLQSKEKVLLQQSYQACGRSQSLVRTGLAISKTPTTLFKLKICAICCVARQILCEYKHARYNECPIWAEEALRHIWLYRSSTLAQKTLTGLRLSGYSHTSLKTWQGCWCIWWEGHRSRKMERALHVNVLLLFVQTSGVNICKHIWIQTWLSCFKIMPSLVSTWSGLLQPSCESCHLLLQLIKLWSLDSSVQYAMTIHIICRQEKLLWTHRIYAKILCGKSTSACWPFLPHLCRQNLAGKVSEDLPSISQNWPCQPLSQSQA